MRAFRTDPPTDFRSYPLKILLDADIGKLHTQRIRDRQLRMYYMSVSPSR